MKKDGRRKVIITQEMAPGDALVLTAAVRDLHLAYPGEFVTDVKTAAPEIWNYNPYVEAVNKTKKDVIHINANYTEILKKVKEGFYSCHYHFINAFHQLLTHSFGLPGLIPVTVQAGLIFLKDISVAQHLLCSIFGKNPKFWVINAGGKRDFTNKLWEFARFQKVVSALPNITFVQVGRSKDLHICLKGNNVINLIDKTNLRELMHVINLSSGVITGISLPMHIAAAVSEENIKPCIVLAGGRENRSWELYPGHYFISRENMLFCCKKSGCWKSRVEKLGDGSLHDNSICRCPVISKSGQKIPKCMDMIEVDEVIQAIKMYEDV